MRDSPLNPVRIFSKSDAGSQILNRIDDKLSRICNSNDLRRNDIIDLTGYLVLLIIERGWKFDGMVD